jgi:hypothetical protein
LHFALQLCVLRLYGRFLTTYDTVPLRIVNHLGRQLGLPPVLLLDPMPRPATDSEYQQRLREYRLFFANQGVFRTGDYEEIMNKVSCLSLLSNAVLVWNIVRMTEILTQLRAAGETVPAENLARVSPLAYAHVLPNGTYHFDRPLAAVEKMSEALA